MEYLVVLWRLLVENAPFLVGFILPPFVEIVNKDVHKEWERFVIAGGICFALAIILHWDEIAKGNPEAVVVYSAIIFAESQTIFKLYFAKSWMRGLIKEKVGANPNRESLNPEAVEATTPESEIVKQ